MGSELKVPRQSSANAITLEHSSAGWRKTEEPSALDKNPDRGGLFKQAFTNRFVFVYATHGSSDENEWSLNKAKFDAETFYYRGNGSVEIVSDDEFLKHFESSGRNAVFFGNEHINSAWRAVSPNNFGMSMENAGCLFTRPGANAKVSYAFVGGSNLVCMRGCDRIPYFVSGTAYPDYLTFDAGLWSQGVAAVRTVGFFGTNWSIETGDWVRR